MMKSIATFIVLMACFSSSESFSKEKEKPPFGVVFGQKYDVSEHKTVRQRSNVRSVKLKTEDRPDDTEDLQAEICDEYGLQIITWRSHIRSLSAATARHRELAVDLTQLYGKPKFRRGSSFWEAKGFIVVAKIRGKDKIFQNQIRYFGPKNEPCFDKLMKEQQKAQ